MLATNNTPDFRAISDFRKDKLEAVSGLFIQVLALCRQVGLVKLGHVALDGTKVKVNASKHEAMSYQWMKVVSPAPRGRIPSHLSPRDRMRRKLQTRRGGQRNALRMQTVEPVFGQIKQGRGFRQFLLWGLEKVNDKWPLICTGHNLLKLFRFGVYLDRKARGDGPDHRVGNFAKVVSTALFAKLSVSRSGKPAKLVVAIHCR